MNRQVSYVISSLFLWGALFSQGLTASPENRNEILAEKCSRSRTILSEPPGNGPVHPPSEVGVDLEKVEQALKGDGLIGRIHAAAHEYNVYVVTYRRPDNFFINYNFPMVAHKRQVREVLAELSRHDQVRIKGKYIASGSPQKHILVEAIEVLEDYESDKMEENFPRDRRLPYEIAEGSEMIAKVHAVRNQGKSLVVEYGDYVVQVDADNGEHTKELYRGDKVRIHYTSEISRRRPLHLYLNEDVAQPIEVIERIADLHGKEAVFEGCLVLFPKSPQIIFDIYALMEVDGDGMKLNFTLPNFEDMEIFRQIREKFAASWDPAKDSAFNDRNKMVNPTLRVRAKGTLNVTSPNQANPQILIASPDDIEIIQQ